MMKAKINPPYRLKSPGSNPVVYEFSIDKPGKKFDLLLLEDSSQVYQYPVDMLYFCQPVNWLFQGGYWVLQIPRVTDPALKPGTWRYKFICGAETAYATFDLIHYTYGLGHLTDELRPILREGYGWQAVSDPSRSHCKQRFIASLTWAVEKAWWEYKFSPIEIQDCSGPGGADISPNGSIHPAGVHAGGGVLDFSYPRKNGLIDYRSLCDLFDEAVRLNPLIHFSVSSEIASDVDGSIEYETALHHITTDDNPTHKHDKHCHAWEQ